jgi:hypothetical protein
MEEFDVLVHMKTFKEKAEWLETYRKKHKHWMDLLDPLYSIGEYTGRWSGRYDEKKYASIKDLPLTFETLKELTRDELESAFKFKNQPRSLEQHELNFIRYKCDERPFVLYEHYLEKKQNVVKEEKKKVKKVKVKEEEENVTKKIYFEPLPEDIELWARQFGLFGYNLDSFPKHYEDN